MRFGKTLTVLILAIGLFLMIAVVIGTNSDKKNTAQKEFEPVPPSIANPEDIAGSLTENSAPLDYVIAGVLETHDHGVTRTLAVSADGALFGLLQRRGGSQGVEFTRRTTVAQPTAVWR